MTANCLQQKRAQILTICYLKVTSGGGRSGQMPYVGFPMIYESPPWIFAAQIYFHWYICLAPPTHWFMRCILPDWWTCLLKGETNHKCKLLNISKDHFQNSLQIRFVQIEKYVCPTPLHVSKGHLQNTDTGRNLFPRGCQQQHGSDPLQGPENNRWWRTHGKSPSRQQTNLLFFSPATTGGPMNSLRKWLYRPRRDDKSLLAKFWWVQSSSIFIHIHP